MANDSILEPSDLQENPAGSRPFYSSAALAADRSSGEPVLEYYIDSTANVEKLGQGSLVSTQLSSATELSFISGTIDYIDQWIDLDLDQRFDPYGSYLDIYKVDHVDGIDDNVAGEVQLVAGQYIELQWEDEGNPDQLSFWEKRVITHELAHVFGLMHPNGDGPNPHFDSADTSLSYNNHPENWAYKLTAMDILAMVEIWGLEDDPSDISAAGDSSSNTFTISGLGSLSAEFGAVQRVVAAAGNDTFLTDLTSNLPQQSGSILLGEAGLDIASFVLPDSSSENALLWLDLYRSDVLNLSIIQATLTGGRYHLSITDSEQIQLQFSSGGLDYSLNYSTASSYGRMNYSELISSGIAPSSIAIASTPPPAPANGGGGGGGGGGGAPTAPASPPTAAPSATTPLADPPLPPAAAPAKNPSTNVLIGFNSADPLIGDANANTLIAGAGAFSLTGGDGADTFVFQVRERFSPTTADVITDFNPAEGDRISLSRAAFPGLEKVRYKVAASPRKLSKLSRRSTNLIYEASQQALYYDSNGSEKGWGPDGGVFAYLSSDARPDRSSFVVEPGL
jgi:Ca2+-binding RTX toxin-like protein